MSKYVMPPRQKMINLIYVVLIAMLAINVSKDALEGYELINDDYQPQINILQAYNEKLMTSLNEKRPELAATARELRKETDIIQKELDELKEQIAQKADRKDYISGKLKNRDEQNAVPDLMLSAGQGKLLKKQIDAYKILLNQFINDEEQKYLINSYLDVQPKNNSFSWENETFSYLTANAGITILNKMETELLTCEKEVLQSMMKEEKQAKEKPDTIDTRKDQIFINGNLTDILTKGAIQTPLVQIVPQSSAILYKGYENKLNFISVGISKQELQVSINNGKIIERNGQYLVTPYDNSQSVSISASNGEEVLARYEYTVKELPEPVPYVVYTDRGQRKLYKGNVPLSKTMVYTMTELTAVSPEGPQIAYQISTFETVFIKAEGNKVISLKSNGSKFTNEQLEAIGQLQVGDKFYITSITVSGARKTNEQIASVNVVLI